VELLGYIIKYLALGAIIVPLIIIGQRTLYKEDKQSSILTIVLIYLGMVILFVLNEYYGFMYD
jgi:hypothetical protein